MFTLVKNDSLKNEHEQGSMPFALLVTVLVISLSLVAVSVLSFQSRKQNLTSSQWETQTAMTSGTAFAAEQIGSQPTPTTVAECENMFPTTVPSENEPGYLDSWKKNTDTANSGSLTIEDIENYGGRSEVGLFRWYVDCNAEMLATGQVTATVQATSLTQLSQGLLSFFPESLISSESWYNYPVGPLTGNVFGPPGTQFNRVQTATGEANLANDYGPNSFQTVRVWEAIASGDSGGDGGWNTASFPIDKTKMYRTSVWVKRKPNSVASGGGEFYLGTRANGGVYNRSNGALNTNPYNIVIGPTGAVFNENVDEWMLAVGYVWPAGSGTGSQMYGGGIWLTDGTYVPWGTKSVGGSGDFVWQDTNTISYQSVYLFYSSIAGGTQQMFNPRFDVVDGTEPTIQDLLAGPPSALPILDAQKIVFKNGELLYATGAETKSG